MGPGNRVAPTCHGVWRAADVQQVFTCPRHHSKRAHRGQVWPAAGVRGDVTGAADECGDHAVTRVVSASEPHLMKKRTSSSRMECVFSLSSRRKSCWKIARRLETWPRQQGKPVRRHHVQGNACVGAPTFYTAIRGSVQVTRFAVVIDVTNSKSLTFDRA